MIIACSLFSIGTLGVFYSYQRGGDASQIMPISQLSVILVVILAFIGIWLLIA